MYRRESNTDDPMRHAVKRREGSPRSITEKDQRTIQITLTESARMNHQMLEHRSASQTRKK